MASNSCSDVMDDDVGDARDAFVSWHKIGSFFLAGGGVNTRGGE